MRMLRTLLISLAMLFPLLPLVALAQSSQPTPQCERSCSLDYEDRVEACAKGPAQGRDACYQQATLTYRTCLAICH